MLTGAGERNSMEMLMAGGDLSPHGGEAAAAGSLPLSRRRRGTQRVAIAGLLLAGLTMLAVAVFAPGDAVSAGFTALAGTVALGLGAVAVAEVASLRAVGVAAFAIGLGCIASALVPELFDEAELSRLLAGGGLILAAFVLIPREPKIEPGVRLPESAGRPSGRMSP